MREASRESLVSPTNSQFVEAAVTYEANKLRLELTGQSARQHSDLHRRIDEVLVLLLTRLMAIES